MNNKDKNIEHIYDCLMSCTLNKIINYLSVALNDGSKSHDAFEEQLKKHFESKMSETSDFDKADVVTLLVSEITKLNDLSVLPDKIVLAGGDQDFIFTSDLNKALIDELLMDIDFMLTKEDLFKVREHFESNEKSVTDFIENLKTTLSDGSNLIISSPLKLVHVSRDNVVTEIKSNNEVFEKTMTAYKMARSLFKNKEYEVELSK